MFCVLWSNFTVLKKKFEMLHGSSRTGGYSGADAKSKGWHLYNNKGWHSTRNRTRAFSVHYSAGQTTTSQFCVQYNTVGVKVEKSGVKVEKSIVINMTMKHEIPLLDLFSGIGGFSYALHKACKTIGYCESSLKCQQILISNMERKLIDSAPIHSDIVHLQKSQLAQQPVMITAGFPCQDISSANPYGDGLKGNRSKLVHHVPGGVPPFRFSIRAAVPTGA
jgi:hypothetical protein